jgi:ATP-dependent Clp protease ATP-binding subunit ClpA
MPNEVFQLPIAVRVLGEAVELAEALGFPELSALDDAERKWRSCLQAKVRATLEDHTLTPAISLHRRRIVSEVKLDSVELTFEPPKRSPAWEEPVRLCLQFVHWTEDELHHALVPVLGLHVFATRAGLLAERVEQHARLVLAGRDKQLTLKRLARLARVQSLQLSQLGVTANRKTPKQLAVAGEVAEEKKSVMEKLAEELPPEMPRADSKVEETAKPAKAAPAHVPRAAFEMEKELDELAEILAGPRRRSVLLIGPPGCGKTALVRELARCRKDYGFGQTPIWSTSGARLMTGPIGFGMWQERCQQMCREAAKTNAILHLNNLAELLEVGKASRGEQSVGSFLRPWIARGEVLAIAECTDEQLAAIERNEPHLAGAFHKMTVSERMPQQTQVILDRVFAAAPGRDGPESAATRAGLDRLHQLHLRYATYSAKPGRPIRFLKNLLADKFPEKVITEEAVIAAFSRETGLPLVLLDDDLPLDIKATREWFAGRVIGQPEAGDRVVDLLIMIKARMARPRKPLASFLFIGPTGTGKTEMAKSLAEFLFGDPGRLVRFDLNEFSDPVSVQRLIGGPAAGDAEGLLTARVREQPFSVVLLDEFEKADASFFDLLLQVLGDGRLTDAAGRVADFCNSVIVMTSNLGAEGFRRGPAGFRAESEPGIEARDHFSEAVRKFLRPEIFNRLDAIVPFRPLARGVVLAIAQRHLGMIQQRDGIRLRPVEWQIEPEVGAHLAERGYDARYGVRPLKRALERELLVPLAEALNRYQKDTPLEARIGVVGRKIQIHLRAKKEEKPRLSLEDGEKEKENPEERLANLILAERRMISRLQRSRAASKVEDEVAILESLERRVAAMKWKSPQMQARLAALPKLRECLKAIGALAERARHLETEALGSFYQREPLEPVLLKPELEALEKERARLMQVLFRLQQEQPDDVVLAFYSEDHEMLFEFAAAYHTVAADLGQIIELNYFVPPPSARSKLTKLLRETPKKKELFFQSPPEKVIGIAFHARGDLFSSRFGSEAGLHVVKEKKKERTCLIETLKPPIESYEPPSGIERQGAIKARNASVCRTFDRDKDVLLDNVLGERPWGKVGLRWVAAQLTQERLKIAIESVTL